MFKRGNKPEMEDKIINIDAGMRGTLKFKSPIRLKINSRFEGELETQGVLIIGEKADVRAKMIKGESITVLGKVKGNIVCTKRLEIFPFASVIGNVESPILTIGEGAVLRGHCHVPAENETPKPKPKPNLNPKRKKKKA